MNSKEEKIQKILDSLDDVQRADPGPFFYTRVQARLKKEENRTWVWISNLISRPAIAFTGLCLVVMINVVVIFKQSSQISMVNENAEIALADEVAMANTSFYDIENPEAR